MNIDNKVMAVQKKLDEEDIWGDVYKYNDLPVIAIEIRWGDWKHEHGRTDYLMSLMGLTKLKVDVTEEDGSDCYSAIHYYIVNQ